LPITLAVQLTCNHY